MQKVFTTVDSERGIVQVTTDDERFYIRETQDKETGNPTHVWLPSSTWIAGYCPKGVGYYKWLAMHGWNEAEAIKTERGKYGTRVHKAIELLLNGEEVAMNEELPDEDLGISTLSAEEYYAVVTFKQWWDELNKEHKVEVVETEHTVWCEEHGFAGTVDCVLKIDDAFWIIDFKTSQNVFINHEAQISSYKHALNLKGDVRLAILQIGYMKNTHKHYKLTEVEDRFDLWLAARQFWEYEQKGAKPSQVQMPIKLSLGLKKNMSKGKKVTKKK